MNSKLKLTKQQAATFYRSVLAEAEDERRKRDQEFDRALGEGRR